MAEVYTHFDHEWHGRINSLVNKLMYGQEIDPETNSYELEAAKLVIKWEMEKPIDKA